MTGNFKLKLCDIRLILITNTHKFLKLKWGLWTQGQNREQLLTILFMVKKINGSKFMEYVLLFFFLLKYLLFKIILYIQVYKVVHQIV